MTAERYHPAETTAALIRAAHAQNDDTDGEDLLVGVATDAAYDPRVIDILQGVSLAAAAAFGELADREDVSFDEMFQWLRDGLRQWQDTRP